MAGYCGRRDVRVHRLPRRKRGHADGRSSEFPHDDDRDVRRHSRFPGDGGRGIRIDHRNSKPLAFDSDAQIHRRGHARKGLQDGLMREIDTLN